MRIGVLTQLKDNYEVDRIISTAKKLGHSCNAIYVNDVVLDLGNNNPDEDGAFLLNENIIDYDLIIVRFVFGYVKRIVAIIKFLRSKGVRVMDNNLESTGYYIDKIKDSVIFYNNNLPIPRTISTVGEQDFVNNCTRLGFPIIIKHLGSGKGNGVFKINNIGELMSLTNIIRDRDNSFKNYLIQQFIPYVQDIRILVINSKVIGAIQRIPKKGDFKANFSQGGSVKSIELDRETSDLAIKAAIATQALDAGVDVLVSTNGKKFILEVNRTPGFKGFEEATGMDVATLIIKESIKVAY